MSAVKCRHCDSVTDEQLRKAAMGAYELVVLNYVSGRGYDPAVPEKLMLVVDRGLRDIRRLNRDLSLAERVLEQIADGGDVRAKRALEAIHASYDEWCSPEVMEAEDRRLAKWQKQRRQEAPLERTDDRAALGAVVDSLPRCKPIVGGSGGHQRYGTCESIGTWECDGEYLCDAHHGELHRRFQDEYQPTHWAETVRLLAGNRPPRHQARQPAASSKKAPPCPSPANSPASETPER